MSYTRALLGTYLVARIAHRPMGKGGYRMQKDLMTRNEVLETLNIKPGTLYAYVSRGIIKTAPHDDGRKSLYLRTDVERVSSRKRGRPSKSASAESTMHWGEPVIASAITQVTPGGPVYRNREAVGMARDRKSVV